MIAQYSEYRTIYYFAPIEEQVLLLTVGDRHDVSLPVALNYSQAHSTAAFDMPEQAPL